MSPISEAVVEDTGRSNTELEAMFESACEAGMSKAEIQRWRKLLDPVALDLCGCKASAWAASLASVSIAAVIIASGENNFVAIVSAGVVTLATAVVAKALGQRAAKRRRAFLLYGLRTRSDGLRASLALYIPVYGSPLRIGLTAPHRDA